MSYVGPTLPQRVGPTMAQRASWRWANVICERWPNETANQNTPLAQRCHAIWDDPKVIFSCKNQFYSSFQTLFWASKWKLQIFRTLEKRWNSN